MTKMHKSRNILIKGVCAYATVLLIVLLYLCVCSCKTYKPVSSSVKTAVAVHDTVSIHDTLREKELFVNTDSFYVHDTLFGVKASDVSADNVTATSNTDVKNGSAELSIHNGKAKCKCDSLTIQVANLIRDKITLSRILDTALYVHDDRTMAKDSTSVQKVVLQESQGWAAKLLGHLRDLLAVIGGLTIVIFVSKQVIKKYTSI